MDGWGPWKWKKKHCKKGPQREYASTRAPQEHHSHGVVTGQLRVTRDSALWDDITHTERCLKRIMGYREEGIME